MSARSFNPCCDEHMQVAQNNVRAKCCGVYYAGVHSWSPKFSCYSVEPMTDDSITDMKSPQNPCEQTWIWAAAKIRNHQFWQHVPCEFRLMPLAMRRLRWSRIRPIIYPCWTCNMWNQINAKVPIWPSVDILRLVEDFVSNLRGSTRINFSKTLGCQLAWLPLPCCEAASREFLFRPVATCVTHLWLFDVGDASKGLLQSRTGHLIGCLNSKSQSLGWPENP